MLAYGLEGQNQPLRTAVFTQHNTAHHHCYTTCYSSTITPQQRMSTPCAVPGHLTAITPQLISPGSQATGSLDGGTG